MPGRLVSAALGKVLPALQHPIFCGSMANAGGGRLVAGVHNGGGFGFLGSSTWTPEKLKEEIALCEADLRTSERTGGRIAYGIGFFGFKLTEKHGEPYSAESSSGSPAITFIDAALSARPQAVWLSFGSNEELQGWATCLRQRDRASLANGVEPVKLFLMVGTADGMRYALEHIKPDVLVVQGIEAGGHGYSASPPLASILKEARTAVEALPENARPPLLAAGGLSDGQSLATVIQAGADGAVFGTRFLLTPEALYSDQQKRLLENADSHQAVRTMAFDHARNELGWPEGVDGRGLVNVTAREWNELSREEGIDPDSRSVSSAGYADFQGRYKEAVKSGDAERIVTWAGTGIGRIKAIQPAAQVVREIAQAAEQSLNIA